MEIVIMPGALADLEYWKTTNNQAILKRIRTLIGAIQENPISGIGKPEKLKHDLSGNWSRRISQEHRIVYEIKNNEILIHSLKGHY